MVIRRGGIDCARAVANAAKASTARIVPAPRARC